MTKEERLWWIVLWESVEMTHLSLTNEDHKPSFDIYQKVYGLALHKLSKDFKVNLDNLCLEGREKFLDLVEDFEKKEAAKEKIFQDARDIIAKFKLEGILKQDE